jgi:hypothetical protein
VVGPIEVRSIKGRKDARGLVVSGDRADTWPRLGEYLRVLARQGVRDVVVDLTRASAKDPRAASVAIESAAAEIDIRIVIIPGALAAAALELSLGRGVVLVKTLAEALALVGSEAGPPGGISEEKIQGETDARVVGLRGLADDDLWFRVLEKVRARISEGMRRLVLDLSSANAEGAAVPIAAVYSDLAKVNGGLVVVSRSSSLPGAVARTSAGKGVVFASATDEAVSLLARARVTIDVRIIPDKRDARTLIVGGEAGDALWARLLARVQELMREGMTRAIVDLTRVGGAESAGAASALLEVHRELDSVGGGLVVLSPVAGLAKALGKTVAVRTDEADALPLLESLVHEPTRRVGPRPPVVPSAWLSLWDRDGAAIPAELGRLGVLHVRVEGTLSLSTGRLVACDLPNASMDRQARSPYVLGLACPRGSFEVLSATRDDDGTRTLVFVGVRFGTGPVVRWELAGKFDNAHGRVASFVDLPGVELARSFSVESEDGTVASLDESVIQWWHELIASGETWALHTVELGPGTNAFIFLSMLDDTILDVYTGLDASGGLNAVVIDMEPIRPDDDEDDE